MDEQKVREIVREELEKKKAAAPTATPDLEYLKQKFNESAALIKSFTEPVL